MTCWCTIPFHEIGNFSEGASLGVLTSEVVEEMKLLPAAYPERYGDATGAALDIHTREGSRGAPLFRISAGIAASEVLGEGWFGSARKGSWLVSARKSYINYLIQNRIRTPPMSGSTTRDLKLNYDLTPRQNLNLFATGGHTDMSMNNQASFANDQYASGKSDFTLARARMALGVSSASAAGRARLPICASPTSLFNNTSVLAQQERPSGMGWRRGSVVGMGTESRFCRPGGRSG